MGIKINNCIGTLSRWLQLTNITKVEELPNPLPQEVQNAFLFEGLAIPSTPPPSPNVPTKESTFANGEVSVSL